MSTGNRRYSSILILFVHPYPHRSRVNRYLVERVRNLDGVVVNDLYECYPDFHIDIQREQTLLNAADLIVFQHPVYWYSSPALLKQWLDDVLEYGFAYGPGRYALKGKGLMSAITTGHRREAYCPEGEDRYTISEMLHPFEQTAIHCGMHYLTPQVIHGANTLNRADVDSHAKNYLAHLKSLMAEGENE